MKSRTKNDLVDDRDSKTGKDMSPTGQGTDKTQDRSHKRGVIATLYSKSMFKASVHTKIKLQRACLMFKLVTP